MITVGEFFAIHRALACGKFSAREIARMIHISRGTVRAIALGRHPYQRPPDSRPTAADDAANPPIGRCKICGVRAQILPQQRARPSQDPAAASALHSSRPSCRACEIRSHRSHRSPPTAEEADAADLAPQLSEGAGRRYAALHASKQRELRLGEAAAGRSRRQAEIARQTFLFEKTPPPWEIDDLHPAA